MGKLRKLLREALTLASALNNTPSSPVHWDQTTLWLTECIFQTVNADFHETQQARHNEIIESMAKLIADVESIKNANTQPHKQVTLSPTREGTEANNCKGNWGTRLQENPQLILQFIIMIQLTSRRILRD